MTTLAELDAMRAAGSITTGEYWPLFAGLAQPLWPLPTADTWGPPADAYLNHGRWLVDCECGSAQLTDPDDRRVFCPYCGNGGTGLWRPVTWPDDWEDIEAAVADVPTPRRNWTPPHT